jgi:RHS repeat-associated protein
VASREWTWATSTLSTKYQHTDALGSPIAMSNEAGTVIERTNYDPYGGPIGKVVDGIGYTGHVMDPLTGLTNMQQRYYDQGVGRFLSVDPVSASSINGGNFNRYWYANNNPYRFKDPDGRLCKTVNGNADCKFDEFKNRKGDSITREEALSEGSKLARLLGVDRGSRILRAEAEMTAKYSAAQSLAAAGGQVTIKGDAALGVPAQSISGSDIVGRMESVRTIASAQSAGNTVASVPVNHSGGPSNGPITFYRDGASKTRSVSQTFGHEILHTVYSGLGLPNRGWANPTFNPQHQIPFEEASDAIK